LLPRPCQQVHFPVYSLVLAGCLIENQPPF